MKKNISINIGGIIFHIEEDGFDRLKGYLDAINQYFSSFEDSKEIIDDIENRIAEIFLRKLSDGKQVITSDEIEELITTMGTVADFEATIEQDPQEKASTDESTEEEPRSEEKKQSTQSEPKRLYRDNQRRVLGGVSSGMAHYFGIDPIWIRLLFLALFFNILFWGLSGITLLVYIILWIVLPPSDELEEDKGVKKLYRNPEDRVLGGVSGGIAAYFGTDVTVIRLLFVLSIFLGGAGIILYIILWIISPEAKTITEKMQMQGEPVTLSNIESNIKQSLKVDEGEESVFVKILLFPFRFVAIIIKGLGDLLGPLLRFLVELIRIVFGAVLAIIGFLLIVCCIVTFLVLIGFNNNWPDYVYFYELPVDLLVNSVGWVAGASILLITLVPAFGLILLGITIIAKKWIMRSYVGWSLLGLWIIGLIGAAISIPAIAKDFRTDADVREERTFMPVGGIPTLRLNDNYENSAYEGVRLKLRGHSDSTYLLSLRIESRGSSRDDARENARATTYEVLQEGDDFIFDAALDFSNATFRFQEADAVFYIPFGQKFQMDYGLSEILTSTLYLNGYRSYQMEGNEWVFERSGLRCLTCEEEEYLNRPSEDEGSTLIYDFEEFDAVKIASSFDVQIRQDDEFKVEIRGDDADDVNLTLYGKDLEIKYRDDWDWWENNTGRDLDLFVYITAPDLESIELVGGCEGRLRGFTTREMLIRLVGASELNADVDPRYLDVELVGASTLKLDGSADELKASIIGASRLEAMDFAAETVDVDVVGASKAEIFASREMEIRAAGVSTVRYRGTDRIRVNKDPTSSVRRD